MSKENTVLFAVHTDVAQKMMDENKELMTKLRFDPLTKLFSTFPDSRDENIEKFCEELNKANEGVEVVERSLDDY